MLTPVHAPNFVHLARRLERTESLSLGPPPTTVVVFDDKPAARDFCRRFARACDTPNFVQLDLRALVGDEAYSAAQGMLKTGGWKAREQLRDQAHGNDPLARECFPKFGGQCYQSLKKFYGAAHGPAHCTTYWVSDAESYPFRPFNLSALAAPTAAAERSRSFLLVPTWYPDRYGCTATTNLYDDGDCAVWIAASLKLDTDGGRGGNSRGRGGVGGGGGGTGNGRHGSSYLSGSARAYQTVYDLNNCV